MQILPLSQQLQQQVDAYTNSYAADSGSGQDFSSILSALGDSSTSATTSSSSSASSQTSLTSSVVESNSLYDSGQTSAATLKVTAEEFSDLEEDLRNAGLSKDDIEELREQVESKDGLSWQSLMQQVNQTLDAKKTGESARASLTEEERRSLQGFLQKIGFNPNESKDLISQFSAGQGEKAWMQILAKIGGMGDNKSVNIRMSELSALAKAAGLDASTAQQFAGIFNANGEARLARGGLQAIALTLRQNAAAINGELTEEMRDPARQVLNDKLKAALNQAMDEAQRDQLASAKESRDVQAQRFNIKEAAAQNNRQTGEAAVNGTTGQTADPHATKAAIAEAGSKAADAAQTAAKTEHPATDAETTAKDQLAQSKDALAKNTAGANTQKDGLAKDMLGKDGQGKDASGQSLLYSKNEKMWRDMWNKVETDAASRASAATPTTRTDAALAAAKAQEALVAMQQQLKMSKGDAAFQRANVSTERVLQTVEQGMLRSLTEGAKQLTLRLDPPDLGKVTVVLQMSSNKEVTATLRTETQDAANILSQQLTQLRQQLEQQGLKVEKLDVQTSLSQDQQAAWQGAGQHNFAQEQGSRASEQRAWGFLRRAAAQDALLAQEMQSDGIGEESSRSALLQSGTAAGINIIA